MATVQRTVECAKEVVELGEGTTAFIAAIKDALDDGFQPGQDLPAILAAALTHLTEAVQGIEDIPEELKNVQTFTNGVFVGFSGLPFVFLPQPEE